MASMMTRVTTTTEPQIALRPVTSADTDFLLAVYAAHRAEELDQVMWAEGQREAFVRMQFHAQDTEYRRTNPHGSFDVIVVDGRDAGRLYVDRRPGDLRVVDISLAPSHRDLGIGGRLLRGLMDEAAESGRRVSIHVEVHNRAARLYARLGFLVAEELGVYTRMEWTP